MPSTIPLYLAAGKAYVWDAQHAATLRVTHHIAPLATGTLPGVAQQNVFLGLPLVLMPEEAVVLVEDGICHFIHTPQAWRPPTAEEIAEHTAHRLQTVSELQAAAAAASEEKKRMFALSKKGKGVTVSEEKEEIRAPPSTPTTKTATTTISSSSSSATTQQQPYFTSIVSHPTPITHPWFHPSPHSGGIYTSLSSALEAGVWHYPSTPLEQARCAVFRSLWKEGMFMGQGVKFGGEFLVYPGDPLRYHSHFVTTTLPTRTTPIRPLELVAWGRLGTATKKAHLLCCVDLEASEGKQQQRREGEGEGEGKGDVREKVGQEAEEGDGKPRVQFYSLEWANFG